jgi:hypothetical protein
LKPTANNNTGFTPMATAADVVFRSVNLESPDKAMVLPRTRRSIARIARESVRLPLLAFSEMGDRGTTLGRADATRFLVPNQIRALTAERQTAYLGGRPLANRLTLRGRRRSTRSGWAGRRSAAACVASERSRRAWRRFGHSSLSAWPDEWDARFAAALRRICRQRPDEAAG